MRPVITTVTTLSTVANGLVTTLAAPHTGAITLNGTFVANGIGTMPKVGRVGIASDGADAGISFIITGTNVLNIPISETLVGPSSATVVSALDYKTVTSISTSGATTGNITVGSSETGSSAWVSLDTYASTGVFVQAVVLSGSPTYSVQITGDNLLIKNPPYNVFDITDANLVAATSNQIGSLAAKPNGIRVTITTGIGAVELTVSENNYLSI